MFVRVVAPDVVPMLHDVVEQGSHPSTDDGDAGVKQHVDRGIQIAKKPRDLLEFRQSGVFPTQFVSLNKKRGGGREEEGSGQTMVRFQSFTMGPTIFRENQTTHQHPLAPVRG